MNSVPLYQCLYPFPTQVFPGTLLPPNYADAENPERLLGRSEVERRRDYIQTLHGQLGEQHPLVQVVQQCLHNTPSRRPSAAELLLQLGRDRGAIWQQAQENRRGKSGDDEGTQRDWKPAGANVAVGGRLALCEVTDERY